MVQNLQEAGNTMINECYSFKHTQLFENSSMCTIYLVHAYPSLPLSTVLRNSL